MSIYTPYNCEQRTEDWYRVRKGILTASNFGAWLLKCTTQTEKKARENAICQLMSEAIGAWQPTDFQNEAMKRGTLYEDDARKAFEHDTGKRVRPLGFAKSNHGRFGCSPDGLVVGENAGVEIKVPIPKEHLKYRRTGVLPDEYKMQVHGSMAVTGADRWYFYCFNPADDGGPGLVPLLLTVERDAFTEQLFASLIEFSGQLECALKDESARLQAWKAREVSA